MPPFWTARTCEQVTLIQIPMKYLTNNVCDPECYLSWQEVSPLYACFQCDGWMLHSLPWPSLDLLYLCRLGEGSISISHLPESPFRESFSSLSGYKYVLFSLKKRDISLFPLQSVWAWETGIKNTSSSLTGLAVYSHSPPHTLQGHPKPPFSWRPGTEPA